MSLKIGQVSKIFNLSTEAIRFYEKCNMISPERKKDSTYREYSSTDVYNLIDCYTYRNMLFSLNEVKTIAQEADLNQLIAMLEKKDKELEREIQFKQFLHNSIQEFKEKLEYIPLNVNHFWFKRGPEYKYISYMKRNGEVYTDINSEDETIIKWIQDSPFVKRMMRVDLNDLEKGKDRNDCCLAVESTKMRVLQLPEDSRVQTIPEQIYLHTVIDAGKVGDLSIEMLKPIMEYVKEHNLEVTGDIWGYLLVRTHEDKKMHRYIEILIPVNI